MKKIVSMLTVAFLLSVLSFPALGQESPRISLINGMPETPLDFEIEGTNVFTNVAFGGTQDISSLAGATLLALKVKLAGTSTVAIEAGDVPLPATGSHSIIAHLDPSGTPTLSTFENDTSTIAAGQGRLVARHTAAAPVVDLLGGGSVVFSNLSNPNDVSADVAAATISFSVVPADASEPVLIGPVDLNVVDGEALIVYVVGSQEDETLQILTEILGDLGTAPTGVDTGNSPVGVPGFVWFGIALGVILGSIGLRTRVARARN